MKPVYRPRWPLVVLFWVMVLAECVVIYVICTGR